MRYASERGASLLIAFFIMTIIIAIFLNVSTILFNEIKIIRNTGDSMVSFYASESGIEKTLYLDKKQNPGALQRGFCNICAICNATDIGDPSGDSINHCNNCTAVSLSSPGINGCDPSHCNNCEVTYTTDFGDKSYAVDAKISPDALHSSISRVSITAKGLYHGLAREVTYTDSAVSTSVPSFTSPQISHLVVTSKAVEVGSSFAISSDIVSSRGVQSVTVTLKQSFDNGVHFFRVDSLLLSLSSGKTYSETWSGPKGVYYIDITACDTDNNCSSVTNIKR